MMKRFLFLVVASIFTQITWGQELPMLSQRIFDAQYITKGVVGARALMEITAHHRSQWIGFKGAPHTQIVSVNAPVGKRLGLGGFAVNDISGPSRNLVFGLTYGYHISLGQYNVGLGVTAGMMRYQFDGGVLDMPDFGDPLWQGVAMSSRWTPEFAVGAFIYNKRRYFGVSVAQLVNLMPASPGQLSLEPNQRANLIAGYDVISKKELVLTPSVFFSTSLHSYFVAEAGITASFYELIIAGAYYRWDDAMIGMVGAKIHKNISLVYSFDYSYTGIGSMSAGSHEVVIQVAFKARQERVCPVYRKVLDKKRKNWKY